MSHTSIQIKQYYKQLKYGDFKKIRERLYKEEGIEVSKSALTHVIKLQTYYNKSILDMAKKVLKEK